MLYGSTIGPLICSLDCSLFKYGQGQCLNQCQKPLSIVAFNGCPTYVLEPKLQKPGVKIPKWAPRSRRGVNMGFIKMHSTQVGLVLNLLTGSISPQYHVVFDDMFSTVMSSTAADPEVWIRLVTSRNSRIQVMLDQEDDPDLDDEWLTADEQLTRFSKFIEQIVGRVKGTESPYVQGPQSSDEDLFVRERVPSRTDM